MGPVIKRQEDVCTQLSVRIDRLKAIVRYCFEMPSRHKELSKQAFTFSLVGNGALSECSCYIKLQPDVECLARQVFYYWHCCRIYLRLICSSARLSSF